MTRRVLIALALVLNISYISAQSKKSKPAAVKPGAAFFENTTYNFGTVQEDKGPVKATFQFKNIGQGPLRILNVAASCGCTVPEWTRVAVKSGDKGTIQVLFDPAKKGGNFHKSLTVETDGDPKVVFLNIAGTVQEKESEEDRVFVHRQGNLRMTAQILNFDKLTTDHADSILVTLYNTSDKNIMITGIQTPAFIRTAPEQLVIMPGKRVGIKYIYYPMIANDFGPRMDETYIFTTDDSISRKIVVIRAHIKEGFSGLTPAERQNAPKIDVAKSTIDMGELYLGEIGTYKLEFTNKGKSDLIIRKAGGTCGCTVADIPQTPVKKGKKSFMTVRLNTKNLRGDQEKQLMIYSNDPDKPVTTLTIKAKVVIPGVDAVKKER